MFARHLTAEALDAIGQHWQRKRLNGSQVFSAAQQQLTMKGTEEGKFLQFVPCPLCGEDRYKIFHRSVTMGRPGWKYRSAKALASLIGTGATSALLRALLRKGVSLHSYAVMQCTRCSFFFRNPTYTEQGLERAYNYGTYSGFLTGAYSDARQQLYSYIYDQIDLDGRTEHFTRRRVLDFGCGFGLLLDFMRSKGWDPYGFDFAADSIELGRQKFGLNNIRSGTLDENLFEGDFDAVTLVSVAAHLTDPLDTFSRVHRVLRPGGALLIWTVNANSYGHRRFGDAWGGFSPNHLIFFEPWSIADALTKAGFAKIEFGNDDRRFKSLVKDGSIAANEIAQLQEKFKNENLGDMLIVFATK